MISQELVRVGPDYERKGFIGGSDIAGILGVSPWASPVTVYQRKTHSGPESAPRPGKKKLFNRGKLWEKVVGEMLEAKLEDQGHRVRVIGMNRRFVDPAVPYFAAEIDYEILLDDIPDVVNVELKTVHPNASRDWGEEETDECPVHYAAQAAWGLGVTGRNACIVAALFGADELRTYQIVRDTETIDAMRAKARFFWEHHVLPGVPPEPQSLRDVDALYPGKETIIANADADIMQRILRFRVVASQQSALVAERELLEFEIKRYMGDATILKGLDGVENAVTWRRKESTRFDVGSFKNDYPKLYKQFSRPETTRVFKVNHVEGDIYDGQSIKWR